MTNDNKSEFDKYRWISKQSVDG